MLDEFKKQAFLKHPIDHIWGSTGASGNAAYACTYKNMEKG